jgi:hypothetical protein
LTKWQKFTASINTLAIALGRALDMDAHNAGKPRFGHVRKQLLRIRGRFRISDGRNYQPRWLAYGGNDPNFAIFIRSCQPSSGVAAQPNVRVTHFDQFHGRGAITLKGRSFQSRRLRTTNLGEGWFKHLRRHSSPFLGCRNVEPSEQDLGCFLHAAESIHH